MARPKKNTQKATTNVFVWKGVKQVGDAALYGENPESYYTQVHVPVNAVGPGDIVDDVEPAKRYTFYLFEPTGNAADAARELDRLRRAGWFKCEAPRFNEATGKYESNSQGRFISATGKFETKDGVLTLGLGTWYALPYSKKLANRKAARSDMGPVAVADAHATFTQMVRAQGLIGSAEASAGDLGQRK